MVEKRKRIVVVENLRKLKRIKSVDNGKDSRMESDGGGLWESRWKEWWKKVELKYW